MKPSYYRCPDCGHYYEPVDETRDPGDGYTLDEIEHAYGQEGWEQLNDKRCGCTTTDYLSPTGSPIQGTLELVQGVALVTGIRPDGEPEYEGETKMFWDSQETQYRGEERIWLDYAGDEWVFAQLVPADSVQGECLAAWADAAPLSKGRSMKLNIDRCPKCGYDAIVVQATAWVDYEKGKPHWFDTDFEPVIGGAAVCRRCSHEFVIEKKE